MVLCIAEQVLALENYIGTVHPPPRTFLAVPLLHAKIWSYSSSAIGDRIYYQSALLLTEDNITTPFNFFFRISSHPVSKPLFPSPPLGENLSRWNHYYNRRLLLRTRSSDNPPSAFILAMDGVP